MPETLPVVREYSVDEFHGRVELSQVHQVADQALVGGDIIRLQLDHLLVARSSVTQLTWKHNIIGAQMNKRIDM